MKNKKFLTLALLVASGATVFQANGCLNAFFRGFTQGFPANNRVASVVIDVITEELLG